ncbi:DUF6415 family natural product biosynthesis protein [Streptomyces sp. MBT62]|uniref:DUF6415 family natural product biosynthesis protein n=1 Tax=Streptomyces sp. MBT62 TaxID=2800410 RepID=UPI0027DBCCCE|nr:DUF6415 family natural product biosynthesis protein [Streptomyces sp. MBT62]
MTAQGWTHPVRRAEKPSDPDKVRWLLGKVQTWQPYVDGLLLDDLAAVLDDYSPSEEEVEDFALRLRGHLMRLANLALTSKVAERDEVVAELVERARDIRSEELPGDHRQAVGHVRRMAWNVNELLERLVETQCLKAAA